MNDGKKTQKMLIATIVIMLIAMTSLLIVFAAVLGTFNGNAVTVNDVASGTVKYSTDGGTTWTASPSAINVADSLYARSEVSSSSYAGPATVTWQLQQDISGTWTNINGATVSTTVTLTGSSQTIYASDDGTSGGNLTPNFNWGTDISAGGSYRVSATVASA